MEPLSIIIENYSLFHEIVELGLKKAKISGYDVKMFILEMTKFVNISK